MARNIFPLLAIFSLLYLEVSPNGIMTFENTKMVISLAKSAYSLEDTVEDVVKDIPHQVEKVATKLRSIPGQLSNMGINIYDQLVSVIVNIPKDFELASQIDADLKIIFNNMVTINNHYTTYYLKYLNGTIGDSLQVFIDKARGIDADGPVMSSLKIYTIACPEELNLLKTSIYSRIVEQLNTYQHQRCKHAHKTPQQFIYDLLSLVETINLRAYLMITTGYTLNCIKTNVNCTRDLEQIGNTFLERKRNYLKHVELAIKSANTEVSNCNPVYSPNSYVPAAKDFVVSLFPQISNRVNNKIVIGVRFVVRNNVIHPQIQEGSLIPGGKISPGSEQWVPVQDIDYPKRSYREIYGEGPSVPLASQYSDLHPISYGTFLHLRNETVPKDHVVVGVKFEVYKFNPPLNNNNEAVVYLRCLYSKLLNPEMNVIDLNRAAYADSLSNTYAGLRSRFQAFSVTNTHDNEFINFHNVYMDMQDVYTDPKLPLTGISVYKQDDPKLGRAVLLKMTTVSMPMTDIIQ